MRLILLGAPGSGKGTISKMLVEKYNIVQISTGDILRGAVAAGSSVGKEAEAYMKRGDLVPDAVIMGIMGERLREPDCSPGFILDGFPRTIPQAEALGGLLKKLSLSLDAVCNLEVPEGVIIKRLTGRRTCSNPSCQAIFNLDGKAPKKEGVCDRCGSALVQRDDEKEDVVRSRLKTYGDKTAPLIGYYEKEGHLLSVAGSESRLLFDQIVAKLGK
ncbi:MAG: adenylate kinase [Spirochaetota bacterium]|jgi:adenylate kinase